jgi:hypothetical protein
MLKVWTTQQITRRVVAEEVAMLIGSFPNANPTSPKVYVRMLIEEIMAANPSFVALEGTCRELRRTKTFAPTIAEVLEVLRKQEECWSEQHGYILDLEDYLEEPASKLAPTPGQA